MLMPSRRTNGWMPWRASLAPRAVGGWNSCCNAWPSMPATWGLESLPTHTRFTRTPSPWNSNRSTPVIWRWKSALLRSSAGTRWPWWPRRTWLMASWAAISPVTPLPRKSSKWASTISSAPILHKAKATWCISSRTPRQVSMRALSWRAGWSNSNSSVIGKRWMAAGCAPIPIRGSCQTSGSFRQAPWASARSARSIRPASCVTCNTVALPRPKAAMSGGCSAMARWMSRSRSQHCRLPLGRSWTMSPS